MVRGIESAIKKGQDSMAEQIAALNMQFETMIDNMNEIIDYQKKICDKLGIEAVVNEVKDNDGN